MVDLKAYYASLDAALLAAMRGNDEPLIHHCEQHGVNIPQNRMAFRGAVMKMVTARVGLPLTVRKAAKAWLDDHNMESDMELG